MTTRSASANWTTGNGNWAFTSRMSRTSSGPARRWMWKRKSAGIAAISRGSSFRCCRRFFPTACAACRKGCRGCARARSLPSTTDAQPIRRDFCQHGDPQRESAAISRSAGDHRSMPIWFPIRRARGRSTRYNPEVVELLHQMNALAKRIQKRRHAAGQIVLDLPEVELVLDDSGKVVDAKPEDQSFTHTLIEMFMVEANEAVARALDSTHMPFLRRIHPTPEPDSGERLKHFVEVAGFRLPKDLDRKAIQSLLASVQRQAAILHDQSRGSQEPDPGRIFAEGDRALRAGQRALLPLHQPDPPVRGFDDSPVARSVFIAAGGQGRAAHRSWMVRRRSRTSSILASSSASPSAGRMMPSGNYGRSRSWSC